jgi:hypothetical protein
MKRSSILATATVAILAIGTLAAQQATTTPKQAPAKPAAATTAPATMDCPCMKGNADMKAMHEKMMASGDKKMSDADMKAMKEKMQGSMAGGMKMDCPMMASGDKKMSDADMKAMKEKMQTAMADCPMMKKAAEKK